MKAHMEQHQFKTTFAENVFRLKYARTQSQTWADKAYEVVEEICGKGLYNQYPSSLLSEDEKKSLVEMIRKMQFIPGGRYLYYAGRPFRAYNNCYLLRAEEDTREEWSSLTQRAMSCLMTGGGIGIDYSRLRPAGRTLRRTGGIASGPIPLMFTINEVGRNVMQGGSRRSAIYASLHWQHEDIPTFLEAKNWDQKPVGKTGTTLWHVKQDDFNFPCPLDMTNISVNYDDAAMANGLENNPVFLKNVEQAMRTGEPGFSFNFGAKQNETLRNAPVSGDTRVLTYHGYQSVLDIVGEDVFVWTGKQWAKTKFVKTKSNVPTVEVNLSNGRTVRCDPEHPFVVWTKQGEKRVAAQDLTPGTAIVCDLPTYHNEEHSDDPEYYGYGFVFGDGSIRNYRGDISCHTDSKKEAFLYAKEVLDAHGTLENRAYFTSRTREKLFLASRNFIAGWFDADGCYSRGLLRISNKDKDVLIKLAEYLDLLGIKNIVREDGESSYKPGNKMYTLQVYKSSFAQFRSLIPTIRIKLDSPVRVRKQNVLVKSVQPSGITENVYCCDVGVDEHSFMAEGVIVSNCTEVTSEDDSDVCNLGSVNLGNIESLEEFRSVVELASKFLVCGTIRADLPYDKVYQVREKNRRLGLGLMGIHEWLLKKGYKYEVTSELRTWLAAYRDVSESSANAHCDRLYLSRPVAYRAIAPTGSIGILASTTTGIEPLFAVAYKRRYLKDGSRWHYEYVVDATADHLIKEYGLKPAEIETSKSLAEDYERRIKFQADIQDYVDMSISSTINLPSWGSRANNSDHVKGFASTLSRYASRLRGFTCYPDGSRGGQPITEVEYEEALKHKGVVFAETDICEISGKGGVCGS